MKRNKVVVYTAIFGHRDVLHDPEYVSRGVDFVCFTDDPKLRSSVWNIRYEQPSFPNDSVRSAKIYKVFPHRYFPEHEKSIWIDGNIIVRGDLTKAAEEYLRDVDMAAYDHNIGHDARNCLYKEAQSILEAKKKGRYKHLDKSIIQKQIERYAIDGYPQNAGLITAMILFRRHGSPLVEKTMVDWWKEIRNNSPRDQLSFNYVAWKNHLAINYIKQNSRDNKYFYQVPHNVSYKEKVFKLMKRLKFFEKISRS